MSSTAQKELESFQTVLNQVVPSGPKQMQKLSYLKRMLEAALIDLHTLNTMPEKQANLSPRIQSALSVLHVRVPELVASVNSSKKKVNSKPKSKKTVRISNTARLRVFRNPTTNSNSNTENENRNIPIKNHNTRKFHKTKTRRILSQNNKKAKNLLQELKKTNE